ncbi:MAG: carboxypeptidase-like regulatory domain-containing protein [Bacteroidota bacterium]
MYLHVFVFQLLWLFCFYAQGQVIKGRVLDHNGAPVPYANIGIIDTQIGTASNEDGLFVLFFSGDYNESTLQVSAISYRTFRVKIADISVPTDYEIRLAPHYIVLDEIEVLAKDQDARGIVEKALKNQPFNYTQKKYQLRGFYRELLRNDDTYVLLTEAAFTVDDKGYHKGQDKRFRLDELRKSNDMRDMDPLDIHYDTLVEGNDLAGFFSRDYIDGRNPKYDFPFMSNFNGSLVNSCDFILDSMSYYNGELVYCISFFTKKGYWFSAKRSYEFDRMVITKKDYAVIEMHLASMPKKITYSNAEKRGNASHLIDGSFSFKSSIYYKKYKGKWYPSVMVKHSNVTGGDRQKSSYLAYQRLREEGGGKLDYSNIEYNGRIIDPDKNNYYRHRQILITSINDHEDGFKKIRNKDLMEKRKYVRSYSLPYNPDFWNGQNVIMRNPYLKAAKSDLIKGGGSLESQFLANGN